MRRVVIVSGACGVGKSDTIRAMRAALDGLVNDVAVLDSDDFYMMIDPHWIRPPTRVERYFEVSGWLLRETALGFLRFGFDWIAIASNGLWRESHVREFVRPFALEGAQVHHVTLDPGNAAIASRMTSRSTSTRLASGQSSVREADALLAEVRSCYGSWTHVLDNSRLSPPATALAIHQAVARGAGRL